MRKEKLLVKKKEYLYNLGTKCKIFRISLGITQRQVAEELNETQNNISFFEKGENNSAYILKWYIERGLIL